MQRIVDSDFKAGFVCKAGYFVSVDSNSNLAIGTITFIAF